MFVQTKEFTWTKAFTDLFLNAMAVRPGAALAATPTVILFKGATPVTPLSAYADFTPVAFSGYVSQTPTFSAPVNMSGNIQGVVGNAFFFMTGGSPPVDDVADGYIVTDGGTGLLGGEVFQDPVPFAVPSDFLSLEVVLPLLMNVEIQ